MKIKQILLLLFVVVFIVGCSNPLEPNQPPNIPCNPIPIDNSLVPGPYIYFLTWMCSDPDGDSLTYDIYFSNYPDYWYDHYSFGDHPSTYFVPPGRYFIVEINTMYYWKVVAKDNQGNSTSGPVWCFTTYRD